MHIQAWASACCRPTLTGQCEKPLNVGRQQIQIPTLFLYTNLTPTRGRPRQIEKMDFTIPDHHETGVLNGSDLSFFYYDIGLDNLQGWPLIYDWDTVVEEFKEELDIDTCTSTRISTEFVQNRIRFTVSNHKNSDNGSKAAAFFRHLRNAFAHYHVVREGENYVLTDGTNNTTMRGLVNAELLKKFCFRFFDVREKILNNVENTNNPTL